MPYFFILPVYGTLLVMLALAAWLTRLSPQLRWASGYLIGGTIGTLPGFVLTNGIVTLAGILPALVAERCALPECLRQACGILAAVTLMLGPFAASTAGIALGFLAGCGIVRRRRRFARRPHS